MTVDEKLRLTLGTLVVENIALKHNNEELNKKVAELEQQLNPSSESPK
jgi:regulator of replication initiation timing